MKAVNAALTDANSWMYNVRNGPLSFDCCLTEIWFRMRRMMLQMGSHPEAMIRFILHSLFQSGLISSLQLGKASIEIFLKELSRESV